MARPREFDPEEAIEKAMQVFWQHGYQEASLPDLLAGMGLTRGSLYKAFKDKKSLFLLVLDRYETAAVEVAVNRLTTADVPDGRDRILSMFSGLLATVAQGDHRGCLLCTAAAGASADDAEIAAAVHRGLARMQRAFEQALRDAPDLKGQNEAQRVRLADVLLTQYIGLRVLARSRLPLGVLEQSVQGVTDVLDGAAA